MTRQTSSNGGSTISCSCINSIISTRVTVVVREVLVVVHRIISIILGCTTINSTIVVVLVLLIQGSL